MALHGYDVVIVGGGSAGCVLAARLSEQPDARILLIEAGSATGPAEMSMVPAWPSLMGGPVDWNYATTTQPGLGGGVVHYPQGKVLGGSGRINAMAHLRGHRADYDDWAATGATGWAYDDLLPYFRRSEDVRDGDARYRGSGGPLRVAPAAVPHPIAQAGLAAVAELGYPLSADLNGASQAGGGRLEMTAIDGVRHSAFEAYLAPAAHRGNLHVVTDAHVRALTMRGGRCVGVEYVRDGVAERVTGSQVVLAAGAIGSPQLLMLSGIGPAAELRSIGIPVVLDAPEVGRNLQDHPLAGLVYSARPGFPVGVNNHADAVAMLQSRPDLTRPDVQLLFMDIPFHPPAMTGPETGYTIGFALLRPHSKGQVRLASADPFTPPLVDPGFYADERDLSTMADALALARTVGATDALSSWRAEEVLPGPSVQNPADMHAFVRRATGTYFHPVGTCRLGSDAGAVVDTELRVNGVDGLRVVDASVLPTIVSANTNATVVAIAERAAEWVSKG
ncbi:GMC family oxidoreductase [Kribbella sp. NPDC051620]|uniref:GMC family oxidoreductase n=1 Tax=Kribbella sp. NPDC051620 TaxID=3364120 RepID=UPI0037B7F9A8